MISLVPQVYAKVGSEAFGKAIQPIVDNIINPVVGLIFTIAVVVFAYGIFEMIWKGGDADARTTGRNHMLGGIIGMFIMLSAWGIIHLIANTIGGI